MWPAVIRASCRADAVRLKPGKIMKEKEHADFVDMLRGVEAVAYLKVPSIDHAKDSSLKRQLDAAKALCRRMRWSLVEVCIEDENQSGAIGDWVLALMQANRAVLVAYDLCMLPVSGPGSDWLFDGVMDARVSVALSSKIDQAVIPRAEILAHITSDSKVGEIIVDTDQVVTLGDRSPHERGTGRSW